MLLTSSDCVAAFSPGRARRVLQLFARESNFSEQHDFLVAAEDDVWQHDFLVAAEDDVWNLLDIAGMELRTGDSGLVIDDEALLEEHKDRLRYLHRVEFKEEVWREIQISSDHHQIHGGTGW